MIWIVKHAASGQYLSGLGPAEEGGAAGPLGCRDRDKALRFTDRMLAIRAAAMADGYVVRLRIRVASSTERDR